MKLRIIYIVTAFMLIFSGCSANSFNEDKELIDETFNTESSDIDTKIEYGTDDDEKFIISNYSYSFEKYEVLDEDSNTNISITYPQISGMKDEELENQVNDLLKERAISVYKDDLIEGLDLQVDASVKLINSTIVSVRYHGYGEYNSSQSIFDVMYATNINLLECKDIDFKEIFTDKIQSELRRDIFLYSGADKVKDGVVLEENSHEFGYMKANEEIINKLFKEYYKNVDSEKYYLNNNVLTLIVPISSGDSKFIELSADYQDLLEAINTENNIWNEIIK